MDVIFTLISYLLKIVKVIKAAEAAQPVAEESAEFWRDIAERWKNIIGMGD